jgi:hypothetical protein
MDLDVVIDTGYNDKVEAQKQADRIDLWIEDMKKENNPERKANRAEVVRRLKDVDDRLDD